MARLENAREVVVCKQGGYFPVLILHGGEVLAFVRTGGGHFGRGGRVTVCRSADGLAWSEPAIAASGDTDVRNPCAGALPHGTILLAAIEYDFYHGPDDTADPENGETRLILFESVDCGRTWQRDAACGAAAPPGSPYGRFVPFGGQLLMPYYRIDTPDPVACCLARSGQGGAWDQVIEIAPGFVEPAVENVGGVLVAALRAWGKTMGDCETWVARSGDGRTWTQPERVTTGSSHPADLTVLSDGGLLMTVAARAFNAQYIMAMVSRDQGATWSDPVQLTDTYENCDFGYPSTVETAPGRLITAYYVQPGFDPIGLRGNPARYIGETAEARAVAWSLGELIRKTK